MSDQTHDHGSRPQVIDLEAEEIRSEATESPPPSTGPAEEPREEPAARQEPPPPKSSRGTATWIIAALVLGALGGGFVYRGVLSNYLPSNQMTALKNQVAALEQNNSDLANQLASVKQGADGAATAAASASDAAAQAADAAKSAAARLDEVGGRLDQTDQRIADMEERVKSAKADLDELRKSMSSLTAVPAPAVPSADGQAPAPVANPADTAAFAALSQRVDALEKEMASLKSGGVANPQAGVTAGLSQALSDLKAKIAAGTSYQAEYDRIARMVPAAAGLDVVAAHAAEGIPDAKGLAAELEALKPSLPQPEPPPAADNSYFGTLMKSLSGIVDMHDIGETDWPQVAEKAAAFAQAGDLSQAIGVIDGAEGDKPVPLTQWRDRAVARLKLEAALSQVSEAVIRQLAAMGGGGNP